MASARILRWVLVNAVGGALVVLVGGATLALAAAIPALFTVFYPIVSLLSFGGIGLGVGFMQWRFLRAVLYGPGGQASSGQGAAWCAIAAAGSILPSWLLLFAGIMGGSNGGAPVRDLAGYVGGVSGAAAIFAAVAGGICGAAVGAIQALVLRRQVRVSQPLLAWTLGTALGWGLSFAVQGGGFGLLITSGAAGGWLSALQATVGGACMLAAWALNGLATTPALLALERQAGAAASTPPPHTA